MSLEKVFKNLYCFLEVLQNSKSEQVANWDKQSLDHAFKWAAYAEQIFRQSQGKPYREKLDSEICKLGCLPWSLGNCKINLALLEHSKEHLRRSLLQNYYITTDLMRSLLTVGCSDECQHLAEVCGDLISIDKLAGSLVSSIDDIIDVQSLDYNKDDIWLQSEARLLVQYLTAKEYPVTETLHSHGDKNCQWTERMTEYASTNHGLVVCSTALAMASRSAFQDVCQVLLNLVVDVLDNNHNAFWSLPPSTLVGLCRCHSTIYTRYMQYLTRCGNALRPDYDHIIVCSRGIRTSWRCDTKEELSYDCLKSRFINLFNESGVAVIAKKTLIDLAERVNCQPNVWADLLNDVELLLCSSDGDVPLETCI